MQFIPLQELCKVVTKGTTPTTLGKSFTSSGINFIKAESILDNHSIDSSKFAFIDEETNALLKRSVIKANDIVFTIAGTLGRFAMVDNSVLPANTNQAVAIIRPNENKNLEQQAETLFHSLFVENVNLTWKDGVLSDLGTVVAGGTPSKTKPEYYSEQGIAWITPKDLSLNKSKFISHGEIDISELGFSKSSATKMPTGTVLFSSRAPIGYIAIAVNEVTTNQGFKSVVPNENIGTAFMYYLLKFLLPTIEGMASGSTFKEISGAGMKSVPVVIPDNETIEKFNTFCTPIFQQQEVLETENSRLTDIRDALLPKLMSGEIDVSNINL